MSDYWDRTKKVCANCKFWPISQSYQRYWDESTKHTFPPWGIGGHHASGHVSDCRRRSPVREGNHDRDLSGSAVWPTTRFDDFCGNWEQRP